MKSTFADAAKEERRPVERIMEQMPGKTVLILGDVILDEYISGEVKRISPEAPVPVVEFRTRSHVPGGAANVAANVAALGCNPLVVGVVGADDDA
jgi:bifunctional ADP-heptose synthase (sugar kinase/adenylyltransferase)